ncbi:PPC domain-containing DNA-binding protein [uncultured Pseudodesulfovibrio sp.]|uniref:PPC domain-containing DNA-binding protein n=1 Tax=uncultured Pseudodesulfovibrio sp. TaxID=2035858 RepID=UPI0029C7A7A5|nr:PPC domain-containing DNA-binding protein [uncultured Pseudodesulfovibrio sp.]
MGSAAPITTVAARLTPGQDLLAELERLFADTGAGAGCVLACVGSLTKAVIRFANQPDSATLEGHFEIISLTGVLSPEGAHCHIAVSDGTGRTSGGHLMEGCRIYTTAEVVIGLLPGVRFARPFDPQTGYPELAVEIMQPDEE